MERKIHSAKTAHKLLFETTLTEEDNHVITPIQEESPDTTQVLENLILEEIIEIIPDPILILTPECRTCWADTPEYVTKTEFDLFKTTN